MPEQKWKNLKKNQGFFLRTLVLFVATVLFTTVAASSFMYLRFSGIARNVIFHSTLSSLSQLSSVTEFISASVETSQLQLRLNQQVASLTQLSNIGAGRQSMALKELDNYRIANPFIHSIYIYNEKTETFFISSAASNSLIQNADEVDDSTLLDLMQQPSETPMIPRFMQEEFINGRAPVLVPVYTFVSDDMNQKIAINIRAAWMNDMMKSFGLRDDLRTFAVDNKTLRVTTSNDEDDFLKDLSSMEYVQSVVNADTAENYLVGDVAGEKSLIVYRRSPYFQWTFIQIVPYHMAVADLSSMLGFAAVFSAAALLVGILWSFLASRKLNQSFSSVAETAGALQQEHTQRRYGNVQQMLRALLFADDAAKQHKALERLHKLGVSIDTKARFGLLLVKCQSLPRQFEGSEGAALLRYAVANLCEEVAGHHFPTYVVEMDGYTAVALCQLPDRDARVQWECQENRCAHEVLHACVSTINATFFCVPMWETCTLSEVSQACAGLMSAANNTLFMNESAVVYSKVLLERTESEPAALIKLENQLVSALKSRDAEKLNDLHTELMQMLCRQQYNSFKLSLSHYILTLNSVVDEINLTSSRGVDYDFNALLLKINAAASLDEIGLLFKDLYARLLAGMKTSTTARHLELTEQVFALVQKSYADPSFSPGDIAHALGMSAAYLGRVYKKATGESPHEYITRVRLEQAVTRLMETEESVAQIAQAAGFGSGNYFHRVFRRSYGVTPAEYRRAGRQNREK